VHGIAGKEVAAIASSEFFTVAATADGSLYSWGYADFGRLGHNEIDSMPLDNDDNPYVGEPRLLSSLTGCHITAVSCGLEHVLAASDRGELFSWGGAIYGRLGHGADVSNMPVDEDGGAFQPTPRLVEAMRGHNVVAVACGEVHSLAVTHDEVLQGQVYSWGCASYGRLGISDLSGVVYDDDQEHYQHTPKLVEELRPNNITKVACGIVHSLAVSAEGRVYAWGCASFGCLGVGDTSSFPVHDDGDPYAPTPRILESLREEAITMVACDEVHSLAVSTSGKVYAWGCASYGRLGLGSISEMVADVNGDFYQPTPQFVDGLKLEHISLVACGRAHSLAATREGKLYIWGSADHGRLGLENTEDMPTDSNWGAYQPVPLLVECLDGGAVTAVACGFRQSFAAQCARPAMSSDFATMLDNEEFSDVVFVLEGTRKIPGHRNILAARSDYFSACFRSQMKEGAFNGQGQLEIQVEDICYKDFLEMLRWLYTGSISESVASSVQAALQLLCVSDRYGVLPLKHHLTPIIGHEVSVENVLDVLETADRLHAFQLRRHCIDYILVHFQEVKVATNCLQNLMTPDNSHLMRLIMKYLFSPLQAPHPLSATEENASRTPINGEDRHPC